MPLALGAPGEAGPSASFTGGPVPPVGEPGVSHICSSGISDVQDLAHG